MCQKKWQGRKVCVRDTSGTMLITVAWLDPSPPPPRIVPPNDTLVALGQASRSSLFA
jgi:hypothetical protein